MIRVLLLIDYSSEFSRGLLRGIINYSKENGYWIFYRLPSYYKSLYGKEGIVNWAKEWKADAIIAQWDTEGKTLLKDLNIPVVLQNYRERSDYFSNLTGRYKETGEMAAKYFIQKRFKNFAFYGNKGVVWSEERALGYKKEVEKSGGNFFIFETESLSDEQWDTSHDELDKWLLSLPKPVAIFACDDVFALQISQICKLNNIKIPEEISLLGVDNDEMICNLSDPPISSIMLDVEKGGYEVARLLRQMVKDGKNVPFNIVVKPVRIVLRKSSEHVVIHNIHIRTVVDYIENNYITLESIAKLVSIVPLSRRILEIKFKEEMGISIYQYIIRCRVEHVAYLLITTDKTLFDIVLQSGFNDCKNISRIFKKFKNCTPYEYRQQYSELDEKNAF
jgi:LacI family transcriptional regulator